MCRIVLCFHCHVIQGQEKHATLSLKTLYCRSPDCSAVYFWNLIVYLLLGNDNDNNRQFTLLYIDWKWPKMSHLNLQFWHFLPIFVPLNLTSLVALFFNHKLQIQCWMRLFSDFWTLCMLRIIFVYWSLPKNSAICKLKCVYVFPFEAGTIMHLKGW